MMPMQACHSTRSPNAQTPVRSPPFTFAAAAAATLHARLPCPVSVHLCAHHLTVRHGVLLQIPQRSVVGVSHRRLVAITSREEARGIQRRWPHSKLAAPGEPGEGVHAQSLLGPQWKLLLTGAVLVRERQHSKVARALDGTRNVSLVLAAQVAPFPGQDPPRAVMHEVGHAGVHHMDVALPTRVAAEEAFPVQRPEWERHLIRAAHMVRSVRRDLDGDTRSNLDALVGFPVLVGRWNGNWIGRRARVLKVSQHVRVLVEVEHLPRRSRGEI
mmetsp:Transcript_25519/g.82225  ORF Transcript_25519/g.82225 Transcript_25519/m.82225 type:complete len:271 (-) Transcript_25519:109-921(-)